MSTRASNARHVRQRKLNTKQPLRIIRENEVEDQPDDEAQRQVPQFETGVEKAEEIEYHLQAVIHAANAQALGAKAKSSYIPTPEATRAEGVQYDRLYPKDFSEPATYIRFSSTVEDCVGVPYCMDDEDVAFLARLNDGKDDNGRDRKDKLAQCSEEAFEEVIDFFEETSRRLQPFANLDNAPILSLEELEQHLDESVSVEAHKSFKPIYQYWVSRKGSRPLMPTIKVRVLDTSNEADDADPYVCFRRREVRQARKTRGRDAQVVEKLKKLRLDLEQARQLVQMVSKREQLNKESLEVERKVFEQRGQLKKVKIEKGIIGEKGADEELLVNQKPAPKPKARQDTNQRRPTIRLRPSASGERPGGDRGAAQDNDLVSLADLQAEAEADVERAIAARKEQHRRWNQHWLDNTWHPITPPSEQPDDEPRWAPLNLPEGLQVPTPPPTLPSESSQEQEKDIDVEMKDELPPSEPEPDAMPGAAEPEMIILQMPGAYPLSPYQSPKRDPNPACRLRYGRGGRCFLEARRQKCRGLLSRGVVSDSDSDEDGSEDFFQVPAKLSFDYRCHLNRTSARPEEAGQRRSLAGGGGEQQQVAAGGSS